LEWIEDQEFKKNLNIDNPQEEKLLIKWEDLSYIDCTWERSSCIKENKEKIKDFKRFNRALLKDER